MSLRLLAILRDQWETFDGFAVAHNMPRLADLDMSRLCNFVYWHLTHDADHQQTEKFRASLWRPPRGVVADARSPWSSQNELSSFAAAKAALGAAI